MQNEINHDKATPAARKVAKSGWKSIGSTVGILLFAPLLAIFITVYVFQSYEVYGLSMSTTLQNGDRLIVQKFSKNWARIRGHEYVPRRGEIIVFDKPAFVATGSNDVRHLIKRVIGLPGERVVAKDGEYTVYNNEFPNGFNPDDGKDYAKDIITTPGNVDISVGPDEVFVSGDNRTNSLDSRNFGAIKTKSITGVATIRFLPIDNINNI